MSMELVQNVILCEVGPRTACRMKKKLLTVEEKVELIEGVAKAGFPVIEVGSFGPSPRQCHKWRYR